MRRMVALVAIGFSAHAAAETPRTLTFADVVLRAAADPALLARSAGLARMQRELAATSRFTREGPTLEAEIGPRWMEDGARKLEASARIEVPILSDGRARADVERGLKSGSPDIAAADAVESRLRLRTAFLDAWLTQARLEVVDAQLQAMEALVASVRKRVEEGAEAPYELALVEGEWLRALSEADASRAARGEAWSTLRSFADLPAEPQSLASPGMPDLAVPDDAEGRFEAGVLRRAVAARGSLETALLELERTQRRSRWFAAATIAKEADESFATVGAAYRFPNRGEAAASERERASMGAAIDRGAEVEAAKLKTRFETATSRAERFGPITSPEAFDDALRAVALRVELGRERPAVALPVRRQLLEAQGAALQRLHDAHRLVAEIDAMIAGEAP
jgi:hypothetical protein